MGAHRRLLVLALLLVPLVALLADRCEPQLREAQRPTNAIEPLPPHVSPVVWLVTSPARDAWDDEILTAYGFPGSARASAEDLGALVKQARRVVVSNAALSDTARAALRDYVERGGWLVELGPVPGVCGPAALHATPEPPRWTLRGVGLDGTRWRGEIATVEACSVDACDPSKVVNWAEAPGAGGRTPLVTFRQLGRGGCTRWLGDLGHAMHRLRQGDPARGRASAAAGQHFKAVDLFMGDLERTDYDVPSADRLGFALVGQIARGPGLDVLVHALPALAPSLVVYTADQDFVPGPGVLAQSAAAEGAGFTVTLTAADIGGTPDVVYPLGEKGLVDRNVASTLEQRGHDFGIHPNLVGVAPSEQGAVIAEHARRYRATFGASAGVVRNHHVMWSGFVDMARLQAHAGLRMNLDYVTLPSSAGGTIASASFRAGFMTGSGLPLRFLDEQGVVLPIYQQATQVDDHTLIPTEGTKNADALQDLIARTRELIEIGLREHVPITVLHHPQWWHESNGAWQTDILAHARKLGVPVWGAGRWLRFIEARRGTQVLASASEFRIQLPNDDTSILVEGTPQPKLDGQALHDTRTIELGGVQFQLLLPRAGSHQLLP